MRYTRADVDLEVALQLEKDRKERRKARRLFLKKNHPDLIPIFLDFLQVSILARELGDLEPDNTKWTRIFDDALKYYLDKAKQRGIISDKSALKFSRQLKRIFKKNYEIFDSENRHGDLCPVCGSRLTPPRVKYCCRECRLSAYYDRRNKRKGIQKKIVRHTNCLICGKSLDGKRAGTKTCSGSCRKSLSLKKVNGRPAVSV
jgi:predicted nucleic acid-binding Zn ribbon protein